MSNPLENIAWDQRLARILAGLLAHTSIHPNAVTTLGLMMGLLAGCLFAQGDLVLANWAAGVFVVFYVFMLIFGWPLFLITGLGLVEQWAGLRRRLGDDDKGQEVE